MMLLIIDLRLKWWINVVNNTVLLPHVLCSYPRCFDGTSKSGTVGAWELLHRFDIDEASIP